MAAKPNIQTHVPNMVVFITLRYAATILCLSSWMFDSTGYETRSTMEVMFAEKIFAYSLERVY